MAKLYFRYGVGKSAQLCQVAYNYFNEKEMNIAVINALDKPTSVSVFLPLMYECRQNAINDGESKDFEMFISDLKHLGVTRIITFEAHGTHKKVESYSLANLFKSQNYTVNAFHMNSGEYYSRTTNYKNWGYNNYYGLIDINEYNDETYTLDRELILNEKFNELMFPTDTNFVNYIII